MARALQYPQRWPIGWLRLAALTLTLVAGVLEAAAARLTARLATPSPAAEREVGVVEIGGQRYGAIYEGGHLVALLEQERL